MDIDKEVEEKIKKELFDIFELNVVMGKANLSAIYAENELLKKAYNILANTAKLIIELKESGKY